MPMMDIDLPAGVHDEAGERALLATLTDTLIRWEGADPAWRLRDIAGFVFNDAEKGRAYAERTLGSREREP